MLGVTDIHSLSVQKKIEVITLGRKDFYAGIVLLLLAPIYKLEPIAIIIFVILLLRKNAQLLLPVYAWLLILIVVINQAVLFELSVIKSSISFILFIVAISMMPKINYKIGLNEIAYSLIALELSFIIDVFYQYYTGYDLLGMPLMNGYKVTGPYPATYVDTLAVIFIAISLYFIEQKRIRTIQWLLIFFWSAVQLLAGSRSAMLLIPSVLVLYSLFNFRFKELSVAILLFGTGLSIVYFLDLIPIVIMEKIMKLVLFDFSSRNTDSLGIRVDLWSYNFNIISNNLHAFILGHGFSSFPFFDEMYSARPHAILDAQSNWLDFVNSIGFLGTLIFLIGHTAYTFKRYRDRVGYDSLAVFLLVFWFLSPLSVQHRFEATWYQCQILFGFVVLSALLSRQNRPC